MKYLLAAVVASLALVGVASAHGGHKTTICHKGKTLSVDQHAVSAHLHHGDKTGACKPTPPPVVHPPAGDTPVTVATFSQVNRILACADRPVIRVADNTMGIAVDLDLATFTSGLYTGARFTVARFYPGIGATCEKLGGAPNGKTQDGYPVWVR
jgi:hypothetical protein